MEDHDLVLARKLQKEFDNESAEIAVFDCDEYNPDRYTNTQARSLSVIDKTWEFTDPNPDVRSLFLQFNDQYFWGKLSGVEVKWSPRMTLCAGVCSYEGRGGLCSIRLSVPLLKLRSRKDLVETLLHEMIHAYLFVTENDRDRDGHGPNFQKHMHRINKTSGSKITIYHDFHDEVDSYRQHWWQCNGPCQKRKPYFGFVKRAMNRAPSSKDFWWEEHQRTCGGTYTKVKEPEGYGGKKKGGKGEKDSTDTDQKASGRMDIRSFLGKGIVLGGSQQGKTPDISKGSKKPSSTATHSVDNFLSEGLLNTVKNKTANNNKTQGAMKNIQINSLFKAVESKATTGIWADEVNSFDDATASKLHLPSVASSKQFISKEFALDPLSNEASKSPSFRDVKTWAVGKLASSHETASVEQVKTKSFEMDGKVLGSGQVGLNWLSAKRKQWAESGGTSTLKTSASSASGGQKSSAFNQKMPLLREKRQQVVHKIIQSSENADLSSKTTSQSPVKLSEISKKAPQSSERIFEPSENASQSLPNSLVVSVCDSEDSFVETDKRIGVENLCGGKSKKEDYSSEGSSSAQYDSFHVSSCEEDQWPTPESYYKKKASQEKWLSTKPSKRRHCSEPFLLTDLPASSVNSKRTASDLVSSDNEEESLELPAMSKRMKFSPAKVHTPLNDSDNMSGSNDFGENVFERVKKMNQVTSPSTGATRCSTPKKCGNRDCNFTDSSSADNFSPLQQASNQCAPDLAIDNAPSSSRDTLQPSIDPLQNAQISRGSFLDSDVIITAHEASGSGDIGGPLVACPVCQVKVVAAGINDHLDLCLAGF